MRPLNDPLVALDGKLEALRYLRSPVAQELHEWSIEQGNGYAAQGMSDSPADRIASLNQADTYWVSEDMCAVLTSAQETMPDDDVIIDAPPSPHGFLVFATPIVVPIVEEFGRALHLNALQWRPARRTLPASKFQPVQVDDGTLMQWFTVPADDRERAFCGPFSPVNTGSFLPTGTVLRSTNDVRLGALSHTTVNLNRHARALWTLMQQPLAVLGDLDPTDKQTKTARRAHTDVRPTVVVTLRRARDGRPTGDAAAVQYSHRWVVRGHWRRQWYDSLGTHKPIWINEHIKGPDDAPLVVKEKVIAWRR
ncbi:hypothetical protein GS896_25650 [Rhodococcus hoagii]|nr:hypothetical protein [Prescottella equi]MBM4654109.1 hypothetical protein [Prescottella equi]MBM4719583.1 hypothetical protein [Prescottella equi]NKR23382.1 hypothetical protein [Prescottella equi]NKT56007.1 hypothetical protein [Prescottella equi]